MKIRPEQLLALRSSREAQVAPWDAAAADEEPEPAVTAPPPEPWAVAYAHPNPDGERKRCDNCFLWERPTGAASAGEPGRCAAHPEEIPVSAEHVCGYHVFGDPQGERLRIPRTLDPAGSGLEFVEGGVSCDRCRWYQGTTESSGRCLAVAGYDGGPAPVEALGCCSRFEQLRRV